MCCENYFARATQHLPPLLAMKFNRKASWSDLKSSVSRSPYVAGVYVNQMQVRDAVARKSWLSRFKCRNDLRTLFSMPGQVIRLICASSALLQRVTLDGDIVAGSEGVGGREMGSCISCERLMIGYLFAGQLPFAYDDLQDSKLCSDIFVTSARDHWLLR